MIFKGKTNEYLHLEDIRCNENINTQDELESPLTFLWFEKEGQKITIDAVEYVSKANQIFCLTEFHQVNIDSICDAKMIRFNRSFYCVLDHDKEVGCKGILFFGASQLPILDIPKADLEIFHTIWKMFEIEIKSNDELQLEMLQSMLKRFIILCTRVFKSQNNYQAIASGKMDIVREYNFLVEQNFRELNTVSEYAALLNKSPKTLSNLFSKISKKTPLQFIQDRKMLEARRLLRFSGKSIKEIAYDIGFEDLQSFGRFFKKHEGVAPSEYR